MLVRKKRWKEIHHVWGVLKTPKYSRCDVENALWKYGDAGVNMNQFIVSMLGEYQFDASLHMDVHLKNLYLHLDGGLSNKADWREVHAMLHMLRYFRLVQPRTSDLLLHIFDVFATQTEKTRKSPKQSSRSGSPSSLRPIAVTLSVDNIYSYVPDKVYLRRIFRLPVITEREEFEMDEFLYQATRHIPLGQRITREAFQRILETSKDTLVYGFRNLTWSRLPTELRLQVYEDRQQQHLLSFQELEYKWQLDKAIDLWKLLTYRSVICEWKHKTRVNTGVNKFIYMKYKRKMKPFFRFWSSSVAMMRQKRKRKVLASVIGAYGIKARSFARIKLYVYSLRKIRISAGKYDPAYKLVKEGFARIREFHRIYYTRRFLWRWHDIVARENNLKIVTDLYIRNLKEKPFRAWSDWAMKMVAEKIEEHKARERQAHFHRLMEDTEAAAKEIAEIEERREKERKRLEDEARELARKEKLALAREKAQAEKAAERDATLEKQRKRRRRRVNIVLKKARRDMDRIWRAKEEHMVALAKRAAIDFLDSKDSKEAMKVNLIRLKQDFFKDPTAPDSIREKQLASLKNIVFLYLEVKLFEKGDLLENVIPKFDVDGKGYLDHEEFKKMLKGLNFRPPLSETQIDAIIKGVDADGDGFIVMKELEAAMKETEGMGVHGSAWKMYTDPAQNVLCYHNFAKDIKIFDYKITEEELERINRDNYVGDKVYKVRVQAREQEAKDWQEFLEDFMARRIQTTVRWFILRKHLHIRRWKKAANDNAIKKTKEEVLRNFVSSRFRGYKARALFKRELRCTYEKIWDLEHMRLFWYNHHTQESTWEEPRLIVRYGDVESPPPWVPTYHSPEEVMNSDLIDKTSTTDSQNSESKTQMIEDDISRDGEGLSESQQREGAIGDQVQDLQLSITAEERDENEEDSKATSLQIQREDQPVVPGLGDTYASSAIVTSQAKEEGQDHTDRLYYYHVKSGKYLPRKPDGLPLCEECSHNFALRRCLDCHIKYCFACHRSSHHHPHGFHQKRKPKRKDLDDIDFVHQLDCSAHDWNRAEPIICDICQSASKLLAGMFCNDCHKNYCRHCFRRFHAHHNQIHHQYHYV